MGIVKIYLQLCAAVAIIATIRVSSNYHNITVIQGLQKLAELTYENQKLEREKLNGVNQALAVFGANWPCMWGEEVTVDVNFFENYWDKLKDGWKFTCGLRKIPSPCIVYSLGSCGNMAFEKGLLQSNPSCVIHIFDKDSYGVEEWFPNSAIRKKHIHFHQMFIDDHDDEGQSPPHFKVQTIMNKLGHHHIDVLKMDIEGAEWSILRSPLPSIGQLLVEVHVSALPDRDNKESVFNELTVIFNNIEKYGLRLFHKEINARFDTSCIELAFIQNEWSPSNKSYVSGITY